MEFLWFDYIVLPVLIMLARIVDVSLDTIRVIMVAKGYRNLAPFVGFFQSLIWLITITRIMANLDNWLTYLGYSAGFGLGTYVGMRLEGKLALGYELVRVITKADAGELVRSLRERGYPVTAVDGRGREGRVGILFVILKRKVIGDVIEVIKKYNPNAFYSIEDMRYVSNHVLLPGKRKLPRLSFRHR